MMTDTRLQARSGLGLVCLAALPLVGCTLMNPGFGEASGGSSSTGEENASLGSESGESGETGQTSETTSAGTTTDTTSSGTTTEMTSSGTTGMGTTTTGEQASTGVGDGIVTLIATKTYDMSMWFDGEVDLGGAKSFVLPTELPVIVGNAGNHAAVFSYSLGGNTVECTYRGGASVANPMPMTEQWTLGLAYVEKDAMLCDNGLLAGEMVAADMIGLTISNGASSVPEGDPQTTVKVTIPLF